MTLDDVLALVAGGESETVEFKETTGRRREAAQTLCAMLNSQGGRVIFGVTPNGQAAGQQVGDRTIEDVVAEIQQIEPPAFPTIDRISVDMGRDARTREAVYIQGRRLPTGWEHHLEDVTGRIQPDAVREDAQ